jgi:hypothetical protein
MRPPLFLSAYRGDMNIQEIAVSNNQRKKLQRAITDEGVLFQDDNGDMVINLEAYNEIKKDLKNVLEETIGEDVIAEDSDYLVLI